MGTMQWIYSDWLSEERIDGRDPLRPRWPDFDVSVLLLGVGLGDESPFYPWPEDWLGRNSASEPKLPLDGVDLVEHLSPQLFEDLFRFGHVLHAYQFRRHLVDRQLLPGLEAVVDPLCQAD